MKKEIDIIRKKLFENIDIMYSSSSISELKAIIERSLTDSILEINEQEETKDLLLG
jgi:hypothetical protein